MEGILSIVLNAVTPEALACLCHETMTDDAVRVVVLRGNESDFELSASAVQCLQQLPQPIVAMVYGSSSDASSGMLDACDIVIATDEPEAETYQLARELAAKDPLALRFTKATLKQVAAVSWDNILAYTSAQQAEIKALQAGRPSARALAIESFLAGKLKPGSGSGSGV
jgi:enoyl-CoA hydratase/carnithine racemase